LVLTKVSGQITKRYRFTYQSGVWGAGGGPQSGTLYVPSLIKELIIIEQMKSAIRDRIKSGSPFKSKLSAISTSSATNFRDECNGVLDYVFIDPPFGSNIMYSELALLWEEWLGVKTNNEKEAIENSVQNKGADEYRKLMSAAFRRAFELLKPGRWMTVEFSNTKASVWNNIQSAMAEAGFIVANVSALDKKKGSFKAVTTPTAVKQDLVISAYKPNGGFEDRFSSEATTEEGVWDFVRTHLMYLPVTKKQAGELIAVPERDPRILFDQMVAFYVRKGYPVLFLARNFNLVYDKDLLNEMACFFCLSKRLSTTKNALLSSVLFRDLFLCQMNPQRLSG
jgi:16S rRNA G966 N2-methylase RsmD